MHAVQGPGHPDDVDLTWQQVRDALVALEGSRVAVRVVERSDPEILLVAFRGTLGALGHAKGLTLFWPIVLSDGQAPAAQDADVHYRRDSDHVEDVGLYLHRDRFQGAAGRAGCTTLAIVQGPVLINVRRT
jgi:hypothetical protein